MKRVVVGAALALLVSGVMLSWLARTDYLFTILSGSMEGAIHTGSLIGVKPEQRRYNVGEIVAFHSATSIITHRIIEVRDQPFVQYRTKGDANPLADAALLPASQIIGPVTFTVPYGGYVFAALKTKLGFALLVLLPATLLILQEGATIRAALQELRSPVGLLVILLILTNLAQLHPAWALFATSASITHFSVTTAAVFPSPTPTSGPCNQVVTIIQRNENTGPGSTNENIAVVNEHCETIR